MMEGTQGEPAAWRRVLEVEELGVLAALFLIGLALAVTTPAFLQPLNLLQVARQASYYGIMAVGMVFVLSMGEVDLSVGSTLTLVNIVTALALQNGAPVLGAVALGLGTGALCGAVNGGLSVLLRIPTIIVTLGTMSVYRGLALVLSNATPVSRFSKKSALFTVGGGDVLGIPTSVVVMVLVGLLAGVLFYRTPFGWRLQAIGSNALAARFSGIPIERYRIVVMTLMGTIAGIAGIMALAFMQSGDPSTGPGFELYVIASAIIGGTALSGGSGSIAGGILGALVIAVIRNGLVLRGLSAYWGITVTGLVIILAVTIDSFIKRRQLRRR
jgi:ribose transport system permease protein